MSLVFIPDRQLIPEVGTKVCFPEMRDIGISYCRLLLHDTMLRDDSYRTGTSDTPVCECGLDSGQRICGTLSTALQQISRS